MTTRAQTEYSDPRAPIVFIVNVNYTYAVYIYVVFKNGGLHETHNKRCEMHAIFS